MAQRRDRGVDLNANPIAAARRCSRPQPPKAGARSDRLEQRRDTADNRHDNQRLTANTVAGSPRPLRGLAMTFRFSF